MARSVQGPSPESDETRPWRCYNVGRLRFRERIHSGEIPGLKPNNALMDLHFFTQLLYTYIPMLKSFF